MSTKGGPAPAAEASTVPKSYHRADIQGLRGVAVVAVVLNHAFPSLFPGGYIGVDVFFVISGFVITGLIRREVASEGRFNFRRFYVRRVYRLLPALAVFVGVTALASVLLVSPIGIQAQSALTGLMAIFWVSNFSLWYFSSDYFSPHVQANPFLHTWSLGVEEQFYLIFPVLLVVSSLVGRRLGSRPWLVFGVVAVSSLASFGFAIACTYGWVTGIRGADSFSFYSVFTRMWEFGAGSLLAIALERRRQPRSAPVAIVGFLGVALILGATFAFNESTPFPGFLAAVPVLGAVLIIACATAGPVARALSYPVPVWIGDLSYSWYLWHWPFIVLGKRALGTSWISVALLLALSLVAAWLSQRYVEERWRRRRGDDRLRHLLPIGGRLVVPVALVVLLGLGGQSAWWSSNVQASAAELNPRPAKSGQCGGFQGKLSTRDMAACTWGADRSGPPIYLVGDSNAGQFTEALIASAEKLERPLVVAVRGGCPLVDGEWRSVGTAGTSAVECKAWADDAKNWLAGQPQGTVVHAAAAEVVADDEMEMRTASGTWTTSKATKTMLWRNGSIAGAKSIRDTGHSVVVVAPIPHLPSEDRPWWHSAECGNLHWFRGQPDRCNTSVTKGEYETRQRSDRAAAAASARAADGHLLDLKDQLCVEGTCDAYREGHWWYRDGLHLSTYGSEQLSGTFDEALKTAAEGA